MRGEYIDALVSVGNASELPPRARRILQTNQPEPKKLGTTSACAENTGEVTITRYETGNYLRVRGEYIYNTKTWQTCRELPPRARRIPPICIYKVRPYGTTSACAENTFEANLTALQGRNYLRVRGEY